MESRNAIIFDLDGTLWEVIEATYKCANEVAKNHGVDEVTKETVCRVFGFNKKEAAEAYFPAVNLQESLGFMDEISELINVKLTKDGGNVYPGLESALKELNEKYDLYIVSNAADNGYIEAFLISSGLGHYFKDYIAASKLNITKAEAIKKVINDNTINKAVYVGDTIKDKDASALAGIPFVHVKYGFGKDVEAKYSVDTPRELPGMIDSIIGG